MTKRYIEDRPVPEGGADQLAGAAKLAGAPREPVDVDDEVLTMLRFADGGGRLDRGDARGARPQELPDVRGPRRPRLAGLRLRAPRRAAVLLRPTTPADRQGFRTILTGPAHPYGDGLWPIPGLGIGYGETKIVECHDLMQAIADGQPVVARLRGRLPHRAASRDAILRSADEGGWTPVVADDAAAPA